MSTRSSPREAAASACRSRESPRPPETPRLYLDLSRLVYAAWGRTPTGIPRVELAYAQFFARHFGSSLQFVVVDALGRFSLVGSREATRFIEAITDYWRDGVPSTRRYARIVARALLMHVHLLWQRWGSLPRQLRSPGAPPLYIIPSQLHIERPALARLKRTANFRIAYVVHDVLPVVFPEYFPPRAEERCRRRMQQAARLADVIVAVSQETESAYAERFARHQTDKRTVVAPLGIGAAPDGTAFPLPCRVPYFVIVGTIEPRKNHHFLLMIWRRLRERLGASTPHLVIIGARGWENENVIDLLERSSQLRPLVHECNRKSDAETAHILRSAQALLLPSIAEGFGLPLAEALALGVPAICSDIAVFREVGSDVPEFVDPLDGLGWLNAIADYSAEGSARRAAQLARLSSWRAPTWDAHFAKILPRLLQTALSDSRRDPNSSPDACAVPLGLDQPSP